MTGSTAAAKSVWVSLAVCCFYGASSVALSLLNKALLSSYKFDAVFFLLASQSLMTIFVLGVAGKRWGWHTAAIPDLTHDTLRAALPIGLTSVANVCCGLIGLKLMNVPLFNSLRRLVAATILVYEWVVLGKVASAGVNTAIGITVLGTLIGSWDYLSSDWVGILFCMGNNVLTAAVGVMQKGLVQRTGMSTFGLVYLIAVISAPLTLALSLVTGEFERIASFPALGDRSFLFGFLVSSAMGLVLMYSSALCTTYNSPLASSITGQLKDVLTTSIGWVAFGGVILSASSIGGLFISFGGAILYSAVSLQAQLAAKAAANVLPTTAASAGAGSPSGKGAANSFSAAVAALSSSGASSSSGGGGDDEHGGSSPSGHSYEAHPLLKKTAAAHSHAAAGSHNEAHFAAPGAPGSPTAAGSSSRRF